MVADDAQHMFAVLVVAREGAELARHLRRCGVGDAGHDGGERRGEGAALGAVIAQAHGHQQAADIGVAQAQGAEFIGELGNFPGGELRHQHRDLQHHRPQPDRMLVALDVEQPVRLAEGHQIERGEIAGGIVQEHVFGAGIGRIDAPARRAGMPLVDGGVVLHARIGAGPGGFADLLPQVAGLQRLVDLAVGAPVQLPVGIVGDRLDEVVGHAHRVVRVLARHRQIGVGIPIGVIGLEVDLGIALSGELNDPLDVVFRDLDLARLEDRLAQRLVALGIEAGFAFLGVAGLDDGVEMAARELGAGDECGHLLLFDHLPVDIGLDIRVIEIDADHLGRAPRRAAGFDGTRRAVADLEEAHQAGGAPAAREPLAIAAQLGEIGAGARAVFEQARFAHPEIHDPALVHQVVADRLDEAGMGLGMLIGGFGGDQLAALEIDVVMALGRTIDAIGPVQPGIEPLRRIGCAHLAAHHESHLVEEGLGVGFGVEIATLPAPIGPGAGQAVEYLGRLGLAGRPLGRLEGGECCFIGGMPAQPDGDIGFGHGIVAGRNPGLAEIFLGQHVAGDLRPVRRDLDILQLKDHRSVGIADFGRGGAEFDRCIGRLSRLRVPALNPHGKPPTNSAA